MSGALRLRVLAKRARITYSLSGGLFRHTGDASRRQNRIDNLFSNPDQMMIRKSTRARGSKWRLVIRLSDVWDANDY
jgi:hypothetical protein